jgi:hypothetical protein
MNNLLIQSGLAIVSIAYSLLPQLALAQNNVGQVECSAVSKLDSSQNSQKKIVKATLLNNSGGSYVLKMRLAGRSDDIVEQVTSSLKVKNAIYAGQDSDLDLQPNGKFSYTYMPRGSKVCQYKGTLTFGSGVKNSVFRK